MTPIRSVVGLTAAVMLLTCLAGAADGSPKASQKDWLRSDTKGQTRSQPSPSHGAFAKSLLVLAVLAAAGYFAWHRSRKGKPSVPTKRTHVRVLSGTPIGPKARAVVAEVGGKLILLGVTEHSVRRLAWLEPPPDEASDPLNTGSELGERDHGGLARVSKADARLTERSSPGLKRTSKFSEVLRDAVGVKAKRPVDPAVALAESTLDRVALRRGPPESRGEADYAGDYMKIEGQAAGLVARLNRRTS